MTGEPYAMVFTSKGRVIATSRLWHRDRADCARQLLGMGYYPALLVAHGLLNLRDPDDALKRRAVLAASVIDDRRLWAAVNCRRASATKYGRKRARRAIMADLHVNGVSSADLVYDNTARLAAKLRTVASRFGMEGPEAESVAVASRNGAIGGGP